MDRPAGEEAEALRLVPEAVTPVSSREVPPTPSLPRQPLGSRTGVFAAQRWALTGWFWGGGGFEGGEGCQDL